MKAHIITVYESSQRWVDLTVMLHFNILVYLFEPPISTEQPPNPKKRGRLVQVPQPCTEVGSSFYSPSTLGERLQLARGVQVEITPEEESILAVAPTSVLVSGLIEILSHSLVVSRMLGSALERNLTTIMVKLKEKMDESSNSVKVTLDVMGLLEEKVRQVSIEVDKANGKVVTLEAKFQTEKVD